MLGIPKNLVFEIFTLFLTSYNTSITKLKSVKNTVNLQYILLGPYLQVDFTVMFTGSLFAGEIYCIFMENLQQYSFSTFLS